MVSININTEKDISIIDLFKDLDLEKYTYHFIFYYNNNRHRYIINDYRELSFYTDWLILISTEDDRTLYYYENMDNMEIITFDE